MQLILYRTSSEPEKLIKDLDSSESLDGFLREESDVLSPSFRIQHVNPSLYNYAYIPHFHRYYYIDSVVSLRTNLWQLELHSDSLMSHAAAIKDSYVILSESASAGAMDYQANDAWVALEKDFTDILEFPQGFLDTGEYILITAGGVVS